MFHSNPSNPSKKRRRPAVVCTECRRRKIACDRNSPCAQCIQSNAACTYYNSYNSSHIPASTDPASDPPPTIATTTATYDHAFPSASDSAVAPLASVPINTGVPDASASLEPLPLSWAMFVDPALAPFSHVSTAEPLGLVDARSVTLDVVPSPDTTGYFFHKSRLYGPAHWMTLFHKVTAPFCIMRYQLIFRAPQYEQHHLFDDISNALFHGAGRSGLQKCKLLARALKKKRNPDIQLITRPLDELVPPKQVADRLVQLYLATFESVLRILHIPSFQAEYAQYWANPQQSSEAFLLQLLLVMAIGTTFDHDASSADGKTMWRDRSTQWIHAAQMRLSVPLMKKHLDFRGVQTQCLVVLALSTNTNALGGDLVWITTASLFQSAMAIGLHVPPSQLPVSPLEAELRRRLWSTVLELSVQASLDSSMPPIVSAESVSSIELPHNLSDSQISSATQLLPNPQPTTTYTQTSNQCALMASLPLRLRIAQALTHSRSELTYELARSMGAELTALLRETSKLMDSFSSGQPSAFQVQLQDLLTRRFLLILHVQFAHEAPSNITYHFSRTVCLECALLLLPAGSTRRDEEAGEALDATGSSHANYYKLCLYGDGLFKITFLVAVLITCSEYLLQLREDSSPTGFHPSRGPLRQAIKDEATFMRRRIDLGETSVKAYAFLVCVLAKINSTQRHNSIHHRQQASEQAGDVVADAAERVLRLCCGILEARAGSLNTPRNSESSTSTRTQDDSLEALLRPNDGPTDAQTGETWSFPEWEMETIFA